MPVLCNIIFILLYILLPTILGAHIISTTLKNREHIKIKNTLDLLTSRTVLDKFNLEEKKRVAFIVDSYINNYKEFKNSIKDDILWAGVGYSINSMGLDNAMRVGIGYTLLRKYVKPAMSKALDGEHK